MCADERKNIERWISEKQRKLAQFERELEESGGTSERARQALEEGLTSPLTRERITAQLTENRNAKRRADQWRKSQNTCW